MIPLRILPSRPREKEETYSRNVNPPASSDAPMDPESSHRWDPMLSDPAAGGARDVVSGSESDDGTFEEVRRVDCA